MDSVEEVIRFKMILFGSESVGKTSLVDRFINDKFEESYISTLGYNVYEKQVKYKNILISLVIYDIGGQEKFRELRKKYAEGADLAFIVYDITNANSFNALLDWKKDLIEFAGEVTYIVVGNKIDLESARQISKEAATKMASELNAINFLETSAKTGKGVEEAFIQIAVETYKRRFE